MNPSSTIGVVIPYYQREAGILARALRSVARQRDIRDVLLVVVDDASPAPAAQDIAEIQEGFPFPLEVIIQPNGGPGSARNRALEALAGRVCYVAFLDSDDEWSDDHLARALLALQQGFDVYSGAGWGTETHFLRLHNDMKYRKLVLLNCILIASQRVRLNEQVDQLRRAIVRDLMHRVAHRKSLPWRWMWDQMRLDPKTYLLMPWLALAVVFKR